MAKKDFLINNVFGLSADDESATDILLEDIMNASASLLSEDSSFTAPSEKELDLLRSPAGSFAMLPLDSLSDFNGHTFKVIDNAEMQSLVRSVSDYGIVFPILVRKASDNSYEIISGHRRCFAAKKAGLLEVPCKIVDVDDDTAKTLMAQTNLLARQHILPSEKALSYKTLYDIGISGGKKSEAIISELADDPENEDSISTIRRFLKLSHLIPSMLEMVDADCVSVSAGVSLSEISEEGQSLICKQLEKLSLESISMKVAEKLLTASKKSLTEDVIERILKGSYAPQKSSKSPKKASTKISFNEDLVIDALPEEVKKLPKDERIKYYLKAIREYATRK